MDVTRLCNNNEKDFYPTPRSLADKMLAEVKWTEIATVLEPSAGKGDLVDAVVDAAKGSYRDNLDIDCVEIDEHLQHILRGKGYRVVYDDFLSFTTFKRYDLIIMNPPFSEADKHLMKAIEMQKRGGSIICILNAETLRNPHTKLRRDLVSVLEKYNADIQYLENEFAGAERETNVEIAVVKLYIPQIKEESDIYEHLKKARKLDESELHDTTDITLADYINAAIAHFNVEVEAGLELIRQYDNLIPYIKASIRENPYDGPMINLQIGEKEYEYAGKNAFLRMVRYKYWSALFDNPKFTKKLTSELRTQYQDMVNELEDYDFNEYNINYIIADMNANIQKGVEETIIQLFDKFTTEHSWYPECVNNIHYYNGWATNKAHKIGKKIIVPTYLFGSGYSYEPFRTNYRTGKKEFSSNGAYSCLCDIEKVLNYLDGNMTADINLQYVLEEAERIGKTKNIECKFFNVTFYKKGTMHITFTNLDLLEKFNIYAARNRRWLPPNYGKTKYQDMTAEERAVIDDFQGKEEYEKVLRRKEYYISENGLRLLDTIAAS